ncbi:hypothetical protein GCM10027074_73650 [Streptomyces deserti]
MRRHEFNLSNDAAVDRGRRSWFTPDNEQQVRRPAHAGLGAGHSWEGWSFSSGPDRGESRGVVRAVPGVLRRGTRRTGRFELHGQVDPFQAPIWTVPARHTVDRLHCVPPPKWGLRPMAFCRRGDEGGRPRGECR